MSLKVERLEQSIKKELAQIIQFEMKNNKKGFITLTDVKLTNDLSQAKIYVNILCEEHAQRKGLETLESSKGFISIELSKRLQIRKTPKLFFIKDTSLEQRNRIEGILKLINKK